MVSSGVPEQLCFATEGLEKKEKVRTVFFWERGKEREGHQFMNVLF